MTELTDAEQLIEQFKTLFQTIEISGRTIMPHSTEALLNSIVEVAAKLFGVAAASIALVNEEERTLKFVVAFGAGNEEVVGMTMPINQGIAGYVAMTGQPIAVSDVHRDTRFSPDTAASTGYVPDSILATPLQLDDRIIGVMEVLDKIDAPSFAMHELELLGMFAHQAAIAIDQARTMENIGQALVLGITRLLQEDGVDVNKDGIGVELAAFASLEQTPETLLAIADLFNELGELGESEQRLCLETLNAFAEYARTRRRFHL